MERQAISSRRDSSSGCSDLREPPSRLRSSRSSKDALAPPTSWVPTSTFLERLLRRGDGGRPRRSFLSFERLVDPAELADIKVWTNDLERSYAVEGCRGVNLDPGLLSLSRFVLATTKDRPQRVALSRGIYADLTLVYENGDYRPLPWTYPDWASEEYRSRLGKLRENLKIELRSRLH